MFCELRARSVSMLAILLTLLGALSDAQVSVLTQHNDSARDGLNPNETILTPSNVAPGSFGKLFSLPVDGYIYTQPLYVPGVAIPDNGTHNVVYVATTNDSVFAFDADGLTLSPLWMVNLATLGCPSGWNCSAVPSSVNYYGASNPDIYPDVGIIGTPVIDTANNTLFAVAKTQEIDGSTTNYVYRLHALNIATGAEQTGSPVVIQGQVAGTGTPNSDGYVVFSQLFSLQRPALVLANGGVYVAFGASGDLSMWHGWIFGFDESTLAQIGVFLITPNGSEGHGGIWMHGNGLAADSAGNLFFSTGNGAFDGATNFSDSYLKLATPSLTLSDYFTPYNQGSFDSYDLDVAAGGLILLPSSAGTTKYPDIMIGCAKNGAIYVIDRDDMGEFNSSGDTQIIQELVNVIGSYTYNQSSPSYEENCYSSPAYWNGYVYFGGVNDYLKMFTFSNGFLSTSAVSQSSASYQFPGTSPSISANGSTNGIVWTIQNAGQIVGQDLTGTSAVLHAYNATNLTNELYNSTEVSSDAAGAPVKFATPTIANGKVYVGTQTSVAVYGLLNSPTVVSVSPNAGPTAGDTAVTITGTNFASGATVMFGSTAATNVTFVSATTIDATSPQGTTGSVNVTVTLNGGQSGTLINGFTYQGSTSGPTVTSLSTTSGPVGTAVTITGTNFGSSQGTSTVSFNGTVATVTSWSGTSIATAVPSGATTGNVVVTVAGVASNGVSFTVTGSSPGPVVTSLNPTSGPVATAVTITGTNFGSSQGTSTASFNGTAATVTSWSGTSIATTVPSGATTGNVVVTVGGVASNGVGFTVTSTCGESSQSGTDSENSDWAFGTPCVTGSNASGYTPTSIQYWVGSPTTASFDFGIYADSSGSPGSLLCHTGTTTVTPIAGWNNISLSANSCPTLSASTRYWIGYITGSNTIVQGTVSGTCPGTSLNSVWASSEEGSAALPNPFGARTKAPTCYSMYLVLTVTASSAPTISSLSTTSGPVGTAVTITGTNFGSSQGTSTVSFNGTAATVTSWSGSSIATAVPSGATTGNVVVTVGGVASNGVSFTVTAPAPTISSLSTTSGPVGTAVTITGTNFGSSQGTSTVSFNGTVATVTSWSGTSIATAVPSGATTGNVVVTVAGVASNGVSFTVTAPAPTISSLSTTSGPVGTAVTITGTNFGSSQGTSMVSFNGTAATVTSWSGSSIATTVPSGATTGNVVVTVGGVASNGVGFTVTAPAPTISSLSTTSGPVGTAVTITGTNFGSSQGTSTVSFNGTAATVTSWSGSSIATTVPSGATTGNVVVTVGGVASNGVSFTVTAPAPTISSLSTTSGPVGTAVTITGTNFGSSQGTSMVSFNGTAATVTSWSGSSIATTVPSGATTGNVVVTVGGVASNGVGFTVTAPAPTISSLSTTSGPVGTAVTITGTNFGSSQGTSTVSFNGTAATVTSWSGSSIATTVPSGATTGNVVVTVAGVASNGVSFTVTGSSPGPVVTSLNPTSGPVATAVTITGTNFGSSQGTSTASFNGTAATVTSWSGTSIATTVPSGATTGNVVVTVGGVASNGVGFTVTSTCGESSQSGTDSENSDWAFGTPCVTGSNASGYTPTSIQYWVGSPTTASFDFGIYADSSGSPGSLLCHTGTTTVTPIAGWNNISLSANSCPTLSASTRYWIGYITGSNTIVQGTVSGTCPGTSLNSVWASSEEGSAALPNPFGARTKASTCYSMYLVLQ